MKILRVTLFLYFSLLAPCGIYAANNTLISNYPAPSGSYNTVVLQDLQSRISSCSAANNGLLFMDTVTHTLELCANGNATPVPSGETCFNRFWSSGGPSLPVSCPAGYTQAATIVDSFSFAYGYTVYSTVCCNTGSTVLP